MSSLLRHDGELMMDHRAGPGLTEEEARIFGMPFAPPGGKLVHAPTLGCYHCGGVQLMNPYRTRERGYCKPCDHYICDLCNVRRKEADYIHRPFTQLVDMITSGKWMIAGGTSVNPILIKIGDF